MTTAKSHMRSELPDKDARKAMMRCSRSKKSLDNSFLIERSSGRLMRTVWRNDLSWLFVPKGWYEIHILKNPFYSYAELDEDLRFEMNRIWEEDVDEEYLLREVA